LGRNRPPQSAAWSEVAFAQAPAASRDVDTRVPRPVRARATSASMTAPKSPSAVQWSPTPGGRRDGEPSKGRSASSTPERDHTTVSGRPVRLRARLAEAGGIAQIRPGSVREILVP
jgi:hypothetical protein